MKQVLIIDNYDSFTFNLVQLVEEILGYAVDVIKNDKLSLDKIETYEYLILSPGPGLPDEAGLLKEIIKVWKGKKKIFGVCLGLQAIGEVYGCKLINLEKVFHGIKSEITITATKSPIYSQLPGKIAVGRYHSWVIDESTMPEELRVTSRDDNGQIMSIEDRSSNIYAVQYHPESIMTPQGNKLIANFLNL